MNRIATTPALSKAVKVGLLAAALLTSFQPSFAQVAPPMAPKVLADSAGAKSGRFDQMHQTRFIEIFLAHRDAKTGKLVAETYNSMFTITGIPASKNTAPQAKVSGVATIMPDEFFNIYDKAGPGMSNYLP